MTSDVNTNLFSPSTSTKSKLPGLPRCDLVGDGLASTNRIVPPVAFIVPTPVVTLQLALGLFWPPPVVLKFVCVVPTLPAGAVEPTALPIAPKPMGS